MTQNAGPSTPEKKTGFEAVNGGRNPEHNGTALGSGVQHAGVSETGTETCPTCGRANSGGLEQFLGRLGITDDMINTLKGQLQNLDIDEYLDTCRVNLKESSDKAQLYAKENPAKVAAGVAALALGAGLLWSCVNREGTEDLEDRVRQLELKRALAGSKYRLDEVLSELGVAV